MKTAVFQVNQGGGAARLLCVSIPTFRDAVKLETTLQRRLGRRLHVELLGRFDHVVVAASMAEFLALATQAATPPKPKPGTGPHGLEYGPRPLERYGLANGSERAG